MVVCGICKRHKTLWELVFQDGSVGALVIARLAADMYATIIADFACSMHATIITDFARAVDPVVISRFGVRAAATG
jgi:hypothetical protein